MVLLLLTIQKFSEVKSDSQFVKLCGREFIRAVIYTCGGSRWRRLLSEQPQDIPDKDNYFGVYNGRTELTEPLEYQLHKMNSQSDDVFQQVESLGELWDKEKKPVEERRDLNELLTTACCKNGCKKKDLSSLC
ncbi:insulin-like peptide INSL5 [Rhinophrynus dorsalis]